MIINRETFYALCSIVSRTLCNVNLQRDFDSARFVIRLNRVLHMSALRPKIQLKKGSRICKKNVKTNNKYLKETKQNNTLT